MNGFHDFVALWETLVARGYTDALFLNKKELKNTHLLTEINTLNKAETFIVKQIIERSLSHPRQLTSRKHQNMRSLFEQHAKKSDNDDKHSQMVRLWHCYGRAMECKLEDFGHLYGSLPLPGSDFDAYVAYLETQRANGLTLFQGFRRNVGLERWAVLMSEAWKERDALLNPILHQSDGRKLVAHFLTMPHIGPYRVSKLVNIMACCPQSSPLISTRNKNVLDYCEVGPKSAQVLQEVLQQTATLKESANALSRLWKTENPHQLTIYDYEHCLCYYGSFVEKATCTTTISFNKLQTNNSNVLRIAEKNAADIVVDEGNSDEVIEGNSQIVKKRKKK